MMGTEALFLRGTTPEDAAWFLDRWHWKAREGGKIYLWPNREAFEGANLTPILPIPQEYTLETTMAESMWWAAMHYHIHHSPERRRQLGDRGVIIFFGKDIMKRGYSLDHFFEGSDHLLAAEVEVSRWRDYRPAVLGVVPLTPLDADDLKGCMDEGKIAEPLFQNPHQVYAANQTALTTNGRIYDPYFNSNLVRSKLEKVVGGLAML